jgi:tripartite-type tricarboxylate transporter receptor subunit TctC
MNPSRRNFLRLTTGAGALPAFSRAVSAQTYPTRPITMIVPVGAGGGMDSVARIMGEHMRQPGHFHAAGALWHH